MRKIITYFIIILAIGMVASCASNEVAPIFSTESKEQYMDPTIYSMMMSIPENERPLAFERRKAAQIVGEYIVLSDNQYSLELTQQEAEKLGVRDTIYDIVLKEINDINKFVTEQMEKGDTLSLPDIQASLKRYKNPEIQYKPETFKSKRLSRAGSMKAAGRLESFSNEPVQATFKAVSGTTEVVFWCVPKVAIFPIYVCSVSAFGATNSKTLISAIGCNRTTSVTVPASGSDVIATVEFRTSDMNGGYCSWTAY
ncbi:MAG: hypothetical protein K2G41_07845 [Duncaniella sp.]|uniref:hypothetical protein n=1 Tax=Duncaniella sp. TaxID=2518496 RepID=UPI0023CA4AFD|nr:hypothetical protein [Duncaniella sp.]MDE6090602.1 hypothetical protein [Duncaniella sp.]